MFGGVVALALGGCDSADRLTNATTDGLTDPAAAADPLASSDSATVETILEDSLAVEDSLALAVDPSGGLPISDEDEGVVDEEEADSEIGLEVVKGPDPAAAPTAEASAVAAVGAIPSMRMFFEALDAALPAASVPK